MHKNQVRLSSKCTKSAFAPNGYICTQLGCIFVYALNCIKIATAIELACGYGGSVGAMKAMGGDVLNLSDAELKQIVTDWRNASPHIVKFWWAVDDAVKTAIRRKTATETHGLRFNCQSGMLFITLPSGRKLCYAHPQIGENRFGDEFVTYMGIRREYRAGGRP